MSGDLAVIPADPTALDIVPDPAAAMVALVDQARLMLAQATGMEGLADVIEWKSRAEAIRVYTQQKDMGHEAELSASEIVRRAERRIGQLIREGQRAGEILGRGVRRSNGGHTHDLPGPTDFAPSHELSGVHAAGGIYAMTDDVSESAFEAAIAEGKAEGNLSRANVARKAKRDPIDKLKGHTAPAADSPRNLPLAARTEQIRTLAAKNMTSPQIADEIGVAAQHVRDIARRTGIDITADAVFGGKFRQVDPNRVVEAIVLDAMPSAVSLARIAYSELDRDRLEGWVCSLSDAIRSLTTLKRNIQKEQTRDR